MNNSDEDAQKAEEGVKKATELDTDKKNADNIRLAIQILGQYHFNMGVAAWNKQDYQTAYKAFDKGLVYTPSDTTCTYYAGLAAIQNKDYKSAIDKYKLAYPEKNFSNHKSCTKETDNSIGGRTKTIELDLIILTANTNAAVNDHEPGQRGLSTKLTTTRFTETANITPAVAAAKDKLKPALPYLLKLVELEPKNVDSIEISEKLL
ncbi:hypothetical protein FQR65_LT17587 [Abscondita terminalis]|nr:hypothetical protein FQR65_LT17587 [Abscondita terminalis]